MATEGFSSRLVRYRSAKGWSQAALAEAAGVAPTQISRYESGVNQPRPQVVAKLAKALGIDFDLLAGNPASSAVSIETEYVRRPEGGADLNLRLDHETANTMAKRAAELGIPVEQLAKAIVLEGLLDRAQQDKSLPQVDIEYLARRVKELLDREAREP